MHSTYFSPYELILQTFLPRKHDTHVPYELNPERSLTKVRDTMSYHTKPYIRMTSMTPFAPSNVIHLPYVNHNFKYSMTKDVRKYTTTRATHGWARKWCDTQTNSHQCQFPDIVWLLRCGDFFAVRSWGQSYATIFCSVWKRTIMDLPFLSDPSPIIGYACH